MKKNGPGTAGAVLLHFRTLRASNKHEHAAVRQHRESVSVCRIARVRSTEQSVIIQISLNKFALYANEQPPASLPAEN